MSVARQDFSDVAIGKTRILYRAGEHKLLKLLRNLALETIVPVCQKVIRGGIHREFGRRFKRATAQLADALSVGNDIKAMDAAIKAVPDHIGPLAAIFKQKPVNLDKAKKARERLQLWVDLEATFSRLTAVEDPSQRQLDELEAAVSEASDLLDIPRTKRQIKLFDLAKRQVIYMQISIKNQHIDQHGSKYESLAQFRELREPKEWAKKKALPFGRAALEAGMHSWQKTKIPASLTKTEDKSFNKLATQASAALLAYMGDKKNANPDEMGARFVGTAVENSALIDELYCQLIKQLTSNPNPDSESRGWDLLSVMVTSVVPSDTLEPFLLVLLRKCPKEGMGQQYLSALHETMYGEKRTTAPAGGNLSSMISTFKSRKDRSRFSVHPGHA